VSSTDSSSTAPAFLHCEDVSVRFGGVVAVDAVSLDVAAGGDVVGLIGPNGSGKSTFVNAVTGLVPVARGRVEVDGRPVPLGRPGGITRFKVFRTYQTPQIDPLGTCFDNILVASPDQRLRGAFGAWLARPWMFRLDKVRWQRGTEALARVGLAERGNHPAGALSYGERRRLEIARAIVAEPKLLLMDEPAAGLNSAETDQLAELLVDLAGDGLSLLVIEHKIAFIERLCHRVVVLELGRQIATGRPNEVWSDPAVMNAYLGEAV
jgi:branched-chain amino acid transport system ATP-binding protein